MLGLGRGMPLAILEECHKRYRKSVSVALSLLSCCAMMGPLPRRHSVNTAEGSNASCHGPITQAHFLEALGIRERLEGLLQTASQEEGEQLISGYYRLVSSSSDDADSQREVSSLLYTASVKSKRPDVLSTLLSQYLLQAASFRSCLHHKIQAICRGKGQYAIVAHDVACHKITH